MILNVLHLRYFLVVVEVPPSSWLHHQISSTVPVYYIVCIIYLFAVSKRYGIKIGLQVLFSCVLVNLRVYYKRVKKQRKRLIIPITTLRTTRVRPRHRIIIGRDSIVFSRHKIGGGYQLISINFFLYV